MKRQHPSFGILAITKLIVRSTCLWLTVCSLVSTALADTTINTTDRYAWGENIGWTNWRTDTGAPGEGAMIGMSYCSGLVWGENVGWIKLGTGTPANGIQYANIDANDFGVNHDGAGNLSGLAWGENIGWIKFEQVSGKPRIDFATGKFLGYAWSENCGWIDLGNNGTQFVKTNSIDTGADTDGDLIADSWELEQATTASMSTVLTHLNQATDYDGDGKSDRDEYLADSNPFDAKDSLRFIVIEVNDSLENSISLEWTSSRRRLYDLSSSTNLTSFTNYMTGLAPNAGETTTLSFDEPLISSKFWRVGAKLPLSP